MNWTPGTVFSLSPPTLLDAVVFSHCLRFLPFFHRSRSSSLPADAHGATFAVHYPNLALQASAHFSSSLDCMWPLAFLALSAAVNPTDPPNPMKTFRWRNAERPTGWRVVVTRITSVVQSNASQMASVNRHTQQPPTSIQLPFPRPQQTSYSLMATLRNLLILTN